MKLYHATDSVIDKPSLEECQNHTLAKMWGRPVAGLFCNSTQGLTEYGCNVYTFSLSQDAKVLDISDLMYSLMRDSCVGYRAALFDTARQAGFDVIRRQHGAQDTSAVVLNFNAIQKWEVQQS